METIKAREHDTVPISGELIFANGALNLYPDLQGERLFKLSLRPSGVVIQPAGYIGYIPLNSLVALEIAPRIPVANVEYLLAKSGLTPAVTLPFVRLFGETNESAAPFLMVLAMRFSGLLRELRYEGSFKSYAPLRDVGPSPRGRLFPLKTALRTRTSRRATAVFEHFERTLDNPVNQLVSSAGRKLLGSALFTGGLANVRLARSIRDGLARFSHVKRVSEPFVPDQASLPANRPILRQLVGVSGVILREQGVRLRGEGLLRLPTFLIKMDDVFEAYVRRTLQASDMFAELSVLDGNLKPPTGAERPLFSDPGPLGNRKMSPDIVFVQEGQPLSVIEIKYKPCPKQPDREHLEQLLTYALAYDVKRAALLYPAAEKQTTALTKLGDVNGVQCYKITLDLSPDDLRASEAELCRLVAEHFAVPD
jgi:5-methylcytosine-specific restriction endonuclease McrBC regulatory subunit McrC